MIQLSSRMSLLRPSPTLAISDKAKKMQSLGINVISLSVGEPDFDTPNHIKDAAIEAIREGKTKYTSTSGTIRLRSAIAEDIARKYEITDYNFSDICVTNGAKQAIFNLISAIIGEEDEVIIPAPYWVSYIDIVRFMSGNPIEVPCLESSGFKLTPSALEESITDKTKLLILNSPNNPGGFVYSKEELKALAAVLLKHKHVCVMTDDIYEHITYTHTFCTILQVEPSLIDRVFIINGVSKGYAMTGWRIGYIASKDKGVISACDTLQSQSTSNSCSISQEAAVSALEGKQDCLKEMLEIFKKRRDLVMGILDKIPNIRYFKPEGAFYVWIDCSYILGSKSAAGTLITDDVSYSEALLEEKLVAVVPGSAFGVKGFIRISYATSEKKLFDALNRILEFHNEIQQ